MKCVCPMGGDRTCPGDCPLAIWATLSPGDRKAQRKAIAEKLYRQKFTMEQIATQLGVNKTTISRDLVELLQDATTQSRTSARGRKNEGRPRGSGKGGRRRKNELPSAEVAAKQILDEGKSYARAEEESGHSNIVLRAAVAREEGRREGRSDPEIDPKTLSLTAQQKLDAAVRQHKHGLEQEYKSRVQEGVRKIIDEMVLPHWKEKIAQAEQLYSRRKGLMSKNTFNTIRRALHPDSRNSISDHALGEAFNTFMRLEKYLLNEKDSPTDFGHVPDSLAEWDKMRRKRPASHGSSIRPL